MISPAKKMQVLDNNMPWGQVPRFLEEARKLHGILKSYSEGELKALFLANDKITHENYLRYQQMNLDCNLTPAVLSYVGIQYQYMAPQIFTDSQWEYVCGHLRILSGFYGILRADDGIVPYRLEMQARLPADGHKDLYEFWGGRLSGELWEEDGTILNLASREYSKAVEPWLLPGVRFVSCVFGTELDGRVKVKATEAKMARGEMVRFLAERGATELEEVRQFDRLGFSYCRERSAKDQMVFLKKSAKKEETICSQDKI